MSVSSPLLALGICVLCLAGMTVLGIVAARRRWNLVAPSTLSLWLIAVVLMLLVIIGGLV